MKKYAIIGAGGFAKEVYSCLEQTLICKGILALEYKIDFVVEDDYFSEIKLYDSCVYKLSAYNFSDCDVFIGIGDGNVRRRISEMLEGIKFGILIHPSAHVGKNIHLSEGTIVTQNVVLTCDIKIGKHAHLNLNTTIGHDSEIGDYFTSAPNVNVSGKCLIGNNVYLGTQASIRDCIRISDNVTVGMGGVVVKDILEEGIYIGVPVKKNSL